MSAGRGPRGLCAAVLAALLWVAIGAAAAPTALWLDRDGRPGASVRDALQLLSDAATDGLVPADYGVDELAGRAAALGRGEASAASLQAAFEGDLDAAMQRFLHDLHFGRVDPRSLGFRLPLPRSGRPDTAALLHAAVAERRLPELAADLRPRLQQYRKLRDALARYRVLAEDRSPGFIRATPPVKPGDAFGDAAALQRRLVAVGDLSPEAAQGTPRYEPALAEGVRRFQRRHGLDADGVLGRRTLEALNVPTALRVQQIELALERLRWLPELGPGPVVGINIPLFRLWAWDTADPQRTAIDMAVVVGRALNTRTPVMAETMRSVIFRPYWNVPRSIVRNELLPALMRDPARLQRDDLEIVRGDGDDAQVVPASPQALALLGQGKLRLRQRPGPKNSLGLVKFVFPNAENIYLHDTPATQLFQRSRRDYSHGCVRLEDPVALAQWLLRDQPRWTRERIEASMAGTSTLRVDLSRPLPVLLFYMTATVMPEDDALHLADDIYGHDARLVQALARKRPAARSFLIPPGHEEAPFRTSGGRTTHVVGLGAPSARGRR
ncbi:MAG: L,D-transpeptidase family protein [Burkholderiaceae bacterium]